MSAVSTVRRRLLRFATIDDLLSEIERVMEANKQGRLCVLGSWTPGQILGHLAAWIEYGYEDRIQLNLRHAELHLSFLQ